MVRDVVVEEENLQRILHGFAIEAQKQLVSTIYQPKRKVIVLAGPTACGKSALALELAKRVDGELISADSMQVYRGMDIGTAKPSKEEQLSLPHHLIDIRAVDDPFNVVDFCFEARHCCQVVLAKGKVPIVVGGSGFYLHSLICGPPEGPPAVPELREALEKEVERGKLDQLYLRLLNLDPVYAATITKRDRQKIIRALEIITLTGKRVSDRAWGVQQSPQVYDWRPWYLYRPKEILHQRITQRCEAMIEQGLIQEVEALLQQGMMKNRSAAQAIGYRQTIEYLMSPKNDEDFRLFKEEFIRATKKYAKRQQTWFKRFNRLFRWLDLQMNGQEKAIELMIEDLQTR